MKSTGLPFSLEPCAGKVQRPDLERTGHADLRADLGAMAFVQEQASFRILRGAAEAGVFPGITLHLRYWFPAKDRTQVTGLFTAAAPISPVLGSSIAGTLAEMDGLRG